MTWEGARSAAGFIADVSAALTAAVAVWLWLRIVWASCSRRKRLESYLKREKERDDDQGMRTILHLMSNLAMTEDQIYSAAFSSKLVSTVPLTDEKSGFAKDILFVFLPLKQGRWASK